MVLRSCFPLLLGAAAAMSFSCAHTPQVNVDRGREPASLRTFRDEQKEQIIRHMIEQDQVREVLSLQTDQLEFAYYVGTGYQQQFDDMLSAESEKQNPNPNFAKVAYQAGISARLAAVQAFGRLYCEQLKYYLVRLDQISQQESESPETRARIVRDLNETGVYLHHVPLSTRIALNGCFEEVHELLPNAAFLTAGYKRLLIGQSDELFQLTTQEAVQRHQEKMIAKVSALRDNRLNDLIVGFTKSMADDFAATDRQPQSLQAHAVVNQSALKSGQVLLAYEGRPSLSAVLLADGLGKEKIPAVFFVRTGQDAAADQRVQSLADFGAQIQSGGAFERQLLKLYDSEVSQDLNVKEARSTAGSFAVRPAFGQDSVRVRELATERNLQVVHTQLQSLDWIDLDSVRIANRVATQARLMKGGIVPMRMDLPRSSENAARLVSALKSWSDFQGFTTLQPEGSR